LAGESNTKRGKKIGKDKKKRSSEGSFPLKIFKSCEVRYFFSREKSIPSNKAYISLI